MVSLHYFLVAFGCFSSEIRLETVNTLVAVCITGAWLPSVATHKNSNIKTNQANNLTIERCYGPRAIRLHSRSMQNILNPSLSHRLSQIFALFVSSNTGQRTGSGAFFFVFCVWFFHLICFGEFARIWYTKLARERALYSCLQLNTSNKQKQRCVLLISIFMFASAFFHTLSHSVAVGFYFRWEKGQKKKTNRENAKCIESKSAQDVAGKCTHASVLLRSYAQVKYEEARFIPIFTTIPSPHSIAFAHYSLPLLYYSSSSLQVIIR